jgi:hypothetical protein
LTIQTTFFAPDPVAVETQQTTSNVEAGAAPATVEQAESIPLSYAPTSNAWNSKLPGSFVQSGTAEKSQKFTYETDVFIVEFDPVGAAVSG